MSLNFTLMTASLISRARVNARLRAIKPENCGPELQRLQISSDTSQFDTMVAMTQVHPLCDASGAHGVR